ncbi:ArsR/SmtB family transcription factor [Herbiconiux liukaitaii]|uniref:ArsR/SmtB family transcription factor n=1 Tax=Herbiconiux liukaitaii TaxID=3342799 RepID=UPI0035B8D0F7
MVVQELSETEADAMFRALADSTRRDILRRAIRHEQSISAIAASYPMSWAAVQKHVSVLERAALISKERRGKEQIVRANLDSVRRASLLLDRFEQLWRDRVSRIDDLLGETTTTPQHDRSEGQDRCPSSM